MSFYVCVTLLTNQQQICVLTCAQPSWSLKEFFPYPADHSLALWRHRWQEASEFLCTKTPLFGESWATKNIVKKHRKCSLGRATNVVFSKFRGWRCKKEKSSSARFFEPRFAVSINSLINEFIRINSGPNILRSCFLHWVAREYFKLSWATTHPSYPKRQSPPPLHFLVAKCVANAAHAACTQWS